MALWFTQLDDAVTTCAAAGLPFCGWIIWFMFVSVLNEVRLLAARLAAMLPVEDAQVAWGTKWYIRAFGLLSSGGVIAQFARMTSEDQLVTPHAAVLALISQLELITWVAGTVLRLPRKYLLPLLGATKALGPLTKAGAGYMNGTLLWATLGIALSDTFQLTPASCRYLSVRAVVGMVFGMNKKAATEQSNRPPTFLWLSVAAAWIAFGISMNPEAADALGVASFMGACDGITTGLPFYDPRKWLCYKTVGEVAKQASKRKR